MVDRYSVTNSTRGPSGATNAYLVGDSDRLLIDPAGRTDALTSACDRGVSHVAVTHHHPDHVQGLEAYTTEFDLTVWARAGRERAFESATGVSPDRSYRPGESLAVAGGVDVLDTPGHATEHTSFVVQDGILSGDLAVAEGSVVVGAPGGDMRAYLSSLRRLRTRNPDRLYPGHGSIIDDPRATCDRLIRHRLDRESRVRAAVEAGYTDVVEIVDAAYAKDITAVSELARATVIAHLEKLAVEGSVKWDGERATPS